MRVFRGAAAVLVLYLIGFFAAPGADPMAGIVISLVLIALVFAIPPVRRVAIGHKNGSPSSR
ncbi:hypothetical protein HCN51_27520 [Nonomuraea sp. FMUSA5-5]|uniref:Uncharacterized protein n=1 Tax=Nonomuraea composti TaxID=2720023 RepID=A0ABX1BBK5_9ACTN|nr:hypothetical protein [Nonomuraea sp. FMUSA5-5]NJP93151.1 hypothetical protein [Nonomuraea sp. FMUSA5-5]